MTGGTRGTSSPGRERALPGDGADPTGRPPVDDNAQAWQADEWIDEGVVRDEAEGAVRRGGAQAGGDRRDRSGDRQGAGDGPEPSAHRSGGDEGGRERLERELASAVGKERVARFEERLDAAGQAFRRGRYEDARRLLRPLAESAPGAAAVRELYGVTLYRLGRWKPALKELEAFRTLTGSVEQHPVLADCYRALGRYDQVEELWDELRAASPGAALVAEGRIVAAGALADQGRVTDAIALLEPAVRPTGRAREHHLRVAYALADLYERAGDLPRARELFQRVAASDPDFVDVEARLYALR